MPITSSATAPSAAFDPRAGRYLIVRLGDEEFGISVFQIREIMKLPAITSVPQTPGYLKGVLNLRGRIVPVVNLRSKFLMSHQPDTERTCIVVVQVQMAAGDELIGIIVDSVIDVILFDAASIEDPPDFGREAGARYVRGMAKDKGTLKMLLDIDQILGPAELDVFSTMSA